MAREIIIRMTDDFDRSLAADETEEFVHEGVKYVIDLTEEHAEEFREFIDRYKRAAHEAVKVIVSDKSGGAAASKQPATKNQARSPEGETKEDRMRIREWAKDNGFKVQERGLIAQDIRDAYTEATGIHVEPNVAGAGASVPRPPQLELMSAEPREEKALANSNGVTPDMRRWAKVNGYPLRGGYLAKEFRDIYKAEMAANHQAPKAASQNGVHAS